MPSSGGLARGARVSDVTRARPGKRVSLAEVLARRRVALGFLFGVVALLLAKPTRLTLEWGGAVAVSGEMLRIWAAGHLNKSREVTMSGPYRWMAHPLYAGSSIVGIGFAIASNSFVVGALVTIYLGATLTAAIRTEEQLLRERFGAEYDRYRREPRGRLVEGRHFSVRRALANREQRAMAGLIAVALLLFLKATYN
jgi:protein-S-isoprenylcysteine O-methyltransferase Ste14